MRGLFAFLLLMFTALSSIAQQPDFDGFVTLANGQKIYCIHYVAKEGRPTLVLLNGLTYTTKPWQAMTTDLLKHNVGLVLYDPRGMGKTLEATGPATSVIPIEQQAEDLAQLLNVLKLDTVDLGGLSYGGAIGFVFALKYPQRVRNLVMMAPYVKALQQQDDYLKSQVRTHRLMFPLDRRSDDEIYDIYLKQLIFQTYPIYEPVVKEHPWRLDAIVHMVRGVRKLKAVDLVKDLAPGKVHLIVAGKDQYVPLQDHNEFWNALSPEQRVSRIDVQGSEHKLPEAVPQFMAGWLTLIANSDARLTNGREFQGSSNAHKAISDSIEITLP